MVCLFIFYKIIYLFFDIFLTRLSIKGVLKNRIYNFARPENSGSKEKDIDSLEHDFNE